MATHAKREVSVFYGEKAIIVASDARRIVRSLRWEIQLGRRKTAEEEGRLLDRATVMIQDVKGRWDWAIPL